MTDMNETTNEATDESVIVTLLESQAARFSKIIRVSL